MADIDTWQRRYQSTPKIPQAAEVLSQNLHLLPAQGKALDVACGLGGNALLMAQQGLDVWAWDYAEAAIEKLQYTARCQKLSIHAEVRDVLAKPPEPASFDVIVVSRFLARALASHLITALRQGGLLFYQTFTAIKVDNSGPSNPDYLLLDNELLQLFSDLNLRVYREENRLGDTAQGQRNCAMLVAERVTPNAGNNLLQ